GSATASSVMIGKTIGEGKTESGGSFTDESFAELKREIKHRVSRMQMIYLLMGAATGLAIFLSRDFIIGFYDITEETKALAAQFMNVLSVTVIGTSYQMTCLTGIVRGGGDTNFVFYNDIIFMWGIVLPCSFIAAFVLKLDPVWIFIVLKSDQIIKCAVAAVKVNRYHWIKKI
ncbi:MAG: MATE family efflux transporter, partial [Eubacteriales bacterium]